jgi:hypothetical protein
VKDPQLNGYRKRLAPGEWLLIGVDLEWPPPPEPGVVSAQYFVRQMDGWSDSREQAALARELTWLQNIGRDELAAEWEQ